MKAPLLAALLLTMTGVLAVAQVSAPGRLPKIAILPFLPEDKSDPREGWSVSNKLISRIDRRVPVRALGWRELSDLMDAHGLNKKRLSDPSVIRQIGKALDVDEVVAGTFRTVPDAALAHARLVSVRGASVSSFPESRVERDVIVAPPEMKVEPPVLNQDEALDMREPAPGETCDGASDRVDGMERQILELKARYWALQWHRGVAMDKLKFNPGSTITDIELKREFYGKMRAWMAQPIVPELTPSEIKEFGEVDEEATRLARRCGIL